AKRTCIASRSPRAIRPISNSSAGACIAPKVGSWIGRGLVVSGSNTREEFHCCRVNQSNNENALTVNILGPRRQGPTRLPTARTGKWSGKKPRCKRPQCREAPISRPIHISLKNVANCQRLFRVNVVAVPPAAAERLEQRHCVGIARGFGLDQAQHRLLISLLG